jgi:hypothetical protein
MADDLVRDRRATAPGIANVQLHGLSLLDGSSAMRGETITAGAGLIAA